MKKAVVCLCMVVVFIFSFAQVAYADELSELKAQMKAMEERHQKEMAELKRRIKALEAERAKVEPEAVEERLVSLEERVEKKAAEWLDRIKIKGALYEYFVYQDNSYFSHTSSHFLETTAKIGVEAKLTDNILVDVQLFGENAIGDAEDYTGVTTDDWNVEIDLANITYSEILDMPLSVTIGWQELGYGDGFLIWDGHNNQRAVWSGGYVRSFCAAKGVYEMEPFQLEGFAAMVDRDYTSYETFLTDATTRTGRRYLYGGNLHLKKGRLGIWDFGVFYKNDKSALHSDTLALSQRGSYTFDFWPESNALPQLTLEGEIVEEFGQTRVQDHALTTTEHDRIAFGGHLDSILSFTRLMFSPYAKTSYIHLSGDDPDSSDNEAFDPMFYGWKDWGKWYMGSINSFNLFNYNQRTLMAEAGLYPTETTMLRGQYFYTELDHRLTINRGRKWSHEFNIIFDWYPSDYFFCGAEFGYCHPLKAAKTYAGDDKDTIEFILWAGADF